MIRSLEASLDKIDFDKIGHHKVGGSMMGSHASTATYLTRTSVWTHEAERYLATVFASANGKDHGGVPSVFPATTFMLCWVGVILVYSNIFSSA